MANDRQYPDKVTQAAMAAYGAHQGFLLAQGRPAAYYPDWEDLKPERQESMLDAAQRIARAAVLPEDLHRMWMARRHGEGWLYGRKYNPSEKTHPHLAGWHLLPKAAQAQFELFYLCCKVVLG